MAETISIPARIDELVQQHGGVRPAARAVKIDHGYLYRLYTTEKKEPTAATLRKLGLRRVVTYVRRTDRGGKA